MHKQQIGGLKDWSDFGLTQCNSETVEQVHSEERTGGLLPSNHDDSVDLGQHCSCITKVQQLFDRRPRLQASGVQIGQASKNNLLWSDDLRLGLPPGVTQQDIEYGPHSVIQIPDDYAEFMSLLEEVRRAGYAQGLADYWDAFPEVKAQFEEFDVLPMSVDDRLLDLDGYHS